ncbi:hypothetical protein CathTA2_0273 [Caldalkalibacillus thermarum TA2.A1]|uniref:Uncharacterized protein n=1 Tax=Caldalkalibacillus thermarum (strain TA2.A1) TaxID=986075 RepID=F5L3B2_CALTT|nr:hypothetical protein CathTA2_0273 [Caldalkalibacillus thermarum TA2.A1]
MKFALPVAVQHHLLRIGDILPKVFHQPFHTVITVQKSIDLKIKAKTAHIHIGRAN